MTTYNLTNEVFIFGGTVRKTIWWKYTSLALEKNPDRTKLFGFESCPLGLGENTLILQLHLGISLLTSKPEQGCGNNMLSFSCRPIIILAAAWKFWLVILSHVMWRGGLLGQDRVEVGLLDRVDLDLVVESVGPSEQCVLWIGVSNVQQIDYAST